MPKKFHDLISRFASVKVLVVGDIMLDKFLWGSVKRISPEAPVPVVEFEKQTAIAGGAANVALNVKGLGADVFLVGICGDDQESEELQTVIEKAGVSFESVLKSKQRQTTVKTRIVAGTQHVVRIDRESTETVSEIDEEKIQVLLDRILPSANIVIISDYAKGLLTKSLLSRLISSGREDSIPVLVDPKGNDYGQYSGASLITPNKKEAMKASRLDQIDSHEIIKVGEAILSNTSIGSLLITEGEAGMTLFEPGKEPLKLASVARKVFDVTGAGDTVIATLAVALGAGATLAAASEISNIAAGLVVEKVGTTSIKLDDLVNAL